jgi:hypothetical protein
VCVCERERVMGEVHKRLMDAPDQLLARIFGAAARMWYTRKISWYEQHWIFAHALYSELRLTVGLSRV